jgi:hypothetical protein
MSESDVPSARKYIRAYGPRDGQTMDRTITTKSKSNETIPDRDQIVIMVGRNRSRFRLYKKGIKERIQSECCVHRPFSVVCSAMVAVLKFKVVM